MLDIMLAIMFSSMAGALTILAMVGAWSMFEETQLGEMFTRWLRKRTHYIQCKDCEYYHNNWCNKNHYYTRMEGYCNEILEKEE